VTVENFTDESESLSSLLQTELQGSDDYMYDQALFVDTRGSLDGDIPARGSLRGEIAFDVPELDGYIFLYQPDLFSDSIPFIIYASDIGTGSSTVEESAESSAGFGVGDTISDDDFRITLNSVRTLDEDNFGSSPDNDLLRSQPDFLLQTLYFRPARPGRTCEQNLPLSTLQEGER
jgi:hypothetical protein